MKKTSVAIYSGEIPSTTFIENLVRAVAGQGYTVYLFGLQNKPVHYNNPDIRVFATPRNKFLYKLWLGWNSVKLAILNPGKHRKLNALVLSMKEKGKHATVARAKFLPVFLNTPDIFHVQWAKSAGEWVPIKEMLGVRLVLSFRGAHINYSPLADPGLANVYRQVFPSYDAFHAVSKAIAQESNKYRTGNAILRVIHTGIDLNHIGNSVSVGRIEHGKKKLNIISVGRFHWKKGYHIAFEAVRKLKAAGFDIRYDLVAGGNDEEARYLVHDMEIREQVIFHGNMSQKQVFERMKDNDLLLLPSVEEGIANVVLEAMAIGLPVLSSDCGGMEEVISDRTTGLLFRNRDTDHMVKCIQEFAGMNIDERLAIVNNARRNVYEHFGLERLGKEMRTLYQDVMGNRTTS